jgi:hypothetical protein
VNNALSSSAESQEVWRPIAPGGSRLKLAPATDDCAPRLRLAVHVETRILAGLKLFAEMLLLFSPKGCYVSLENARLKISEQDLRGKINRDCAESFYHCQEAEFYEAAQC